MSPEIAREPPYPFAPVPVEDASGLLPTSVPALFADAVRRAIAAARERAALLWERPAFRLLALPAAAAMMALGAGVHHVYFDRTGLPDVESFVRFEAPTIGEVYDTRGEVLIELAREYRRILRYDEIPPVVRNAVLDAEDAEFFCHSGIDYAALPRVVWKTLAHSAAATHRVWTEEQRFRPVLVFPQGGSTITQQLVRGFFLRHLTSGEESGTLLGASPTLRVAARALGVPAANKLARKIEEIRLSLWLEEELVRRLGSKQRAKEAILARYASFIYMGHGRYGLAAASEYYFGRPLATMTDGDADEAAILAGVTKSPRAYAPSEQNLERPWRRRNHILAAMVRSGSLAPASAARLSAQPIALAARSKVKTEAPAVVENVFRELERFEDERLGVGQFVQGRIRVYSTVDREIQRVVNEALENGLREYEVRHPENKSRVQGSVVVLHNADGRVLAEAGGRRVFNERYTSYSDFNRVTDSWRQAGSVMKPLVYLAAFRDGASLDDVVPDAPIAVPMGAGRPVKWIQNYDRRFKGAIPVRQALAESRNAATVWIARSIGLPKVLETARAYGIKSRLQPYVTTALGASEVQLLELANAYRAMASGRTAEPHVIDRVTDADGAVLFTNRPRVEPLEADAFALRQIQEGLRGVIRIPGGTAHSLDAFPIAVMGKTGTSSDFRDALFVGSTYGPDGITVAVRIGFDDNRALGDKETGGRAALPIFREIMLQVYERQLARPPSSFPREMEGRIDEYILAASAPVPAVVEAVAAPGVDVRPPVAGEAVLPSDLGAAATAPGASGETLSGVASLSPLVAARFESVMPIEEDALVAPHRQRGLARSNGTTQPP